MLLISPLTLDELSRAPLAVQEVWKNIPMEFIEEVSIDEAVDDLAGSYLENEVLGYASQADAIHVAAATVASADMILSWNFKHIVNYHRIRGFNQVNEKMGYKDLTILSPLEVMYDDEE